MPNADLLSMSIPEIYNIIVKNDWSMDELLNAYEVDPSIALEVGHSLIDDLTAYEESLTSIPENCLSVSQGVDETLYDYAEMDEEDLFEMGQAVAKPIFKDESKDEIILIEELGDNAYDENTKSLESQGHSSLGVEEPEMANKGEVLNFGCGIRQVAKKTFQFVEFSKDASLGWGKTYDIKNPFSEFKIRKFLSRYVYPHLIAREQLVLDFIIDRTIGWGKTSEHIPKWLFSSHTPYSGGTSLTYPTVNKALKFLTTAGFIHIEPSYTHIPRYSVNFEAISAWLIANGYGIKQHYAKSTA